MGDVKVSNAYKVVVSTPTGAERAEVVLEVTPTFRTTKDAHGFAGASFVSTDRRVNRKARPEVVSLSSRTSTTTTARFVATVPGDGKRYNLFVDFGAECPRGRSGALLLHKVVVAGRTTPYD